MLRLVRCPVMPIRQLRPREWHLRQNPLATSLVAPGGSQASTLKLSELLPP